MLGATFGSSGVGAGRDGVVDTTIVGFEKSFLVP